ncbi:MAG: peptide chain release factor 2, partial [Solirubrobacteraceae bacterium]|nr:peptide chain release factor 2 [Solirubrobacteraceae bacterium]
MGEPSFWDDPEAAGKVNSQYARATRRLNTFTGLQADVDDLDGLVEMAEEDPELEAEVEDALRSVEA